MPDPTPDLLARWATEFAATVWSEVFRHPGADPDDADEAAWARAMRPVAQAIATEKVRVASIDPDTGRAVTTGAAWSVRFALRNLECRPTWAQVEQILEQHLGVERQRAMTGEEAAARRLVTAPDPLALPAPPPREDVPSWLSRFPVLDGDGPFARTMMVCLSHMDDRTAHRTLDRIESESREARRAREDKRVERERKQAAAAARQTGGDRVGDLLRQVRRMREGAPALRVVEDGL